MDIMDMNLLGALDALLSEGSVTGAARRLGLSPSAMSRTLARLRSATGDPLLVRAGRGLVPTPRAAALRDRVHGLTRDVRAVLSPQVGHLDLGGLERTFTLRAGEGFVERFSAPLVSAVMAVAPKVRLRFAPKPDKDALPLRDGQIDLEIGVLGESAPEIRTRLLWRDDFIGVVRIGHPLLAGPMSPERFAAARHVVASRRGKPTGPVDDALEVLGLKRDIVAVVPGFPDALGVARETDLVALAPRSSLVGRDGVDPMASGLVGFDLPVRTPSISILAMWHPRMDADSAHRWLRDTVAAVCRSATRAVSGP
jgi:DNA-binding transcriptional LysR family regulator